LLAVYDAATGKRINSFGTLGKGKEQLSRPNGIWVIDSLLIIVERDNKRIQVFTLPEFKSLGFIAENKLKKPYGLYVFKTGNNYNLYVTDQYEIQEDSIPPDSLLGERVQYYTFTVNGNKLNSSLVKKFGDTTGEGVLKVVESIYADPQNDNLLIAEELETDTYIKVYSLDGTFKNKVVGKGLFKYQAEGMALLDCGNGTGYWICTDQSKHDNTYYVFDRKTLEKVTFFKLPNTSNTDGVWLTQKPFGNFTEGAFFAVNNDGGVNAVGIREIIEKCKLKCQ
jgi:3-phytase